MRVLFLVAVSLALGLAASPVEASNCAVDAYDHNGSLMEMQVCDGGGMSISYTQPRRGLIGVGVTSGTLLFEGVEQAGGAISGQATALRQDMRPRPLPRHGPQSRRLDHPPGQCAQG
ncbi:MAG TPA: hypothetical protein VMW05_09005 [Methyloceanibacter sp.]|nr:hypothetical protein [Methyloceanibacter sp.]